VRLAAGVDVGENSRYLNYSSYQRLVENVVDDADHVCARFDLEVEELPHKLLELFGRQLVEDRLAGAQQLRKAKTTKKGMFTLETEKLRL